MKCVEHINEETKPVSCVYIAVWHSAKFKVVANTTIIRITKLLDKNLLLFKIYMYYDS